MKYKFEGEFSISGKPLVGELVLPSSGINLILGPNGIGKTTFLNLLRDHQQRFSLENNSSFVSQYRLAPVNSITVSDIFQILAENFTSRVVSPLKDYDLIDELGAKNLLNKEARNLSGGENQLVKILLAFYIKARYYFLDEPFQYLDQDKFKAIIKFISEADNISLNIVDHRNPELSKYANFVHQLKEYDGEIKIEQVNK